MMRPDVPDGPAFDQIGEGYFAVMIDQGEGMMPYQGFTPIAGRSLSDCAEAYFAQSEQLPTRFALSLRPVANARAGRKLAGGGRDDPAHAQGLALCQG
jgi:molecular chaperone Hsp33